MSNFIYYKKSMGTNLSKDLIVDPNKEYNCSDITVSKGFTSLMLIVLSTKEKPDAIKLLKHYLEINDDINKTNNKNWTALMLACRNYPEKSTEECIRLLLSHGANPNISSDRGWTALMMTARYGIKSDNIIKMLLENGSNVNKKNDVGYTALHLALHNDKSNTSKKLVRMLINSGADVNSKTEEGHTPLMLASTLNNKKKSTELVKILLEAGADVNKKAKNKFTALMFACMSDSPSFEKIQLLLDAGADLEIMNQNHLTVLGEVIKNKKSPELVEFLINNGADVNYSKDDNKSSILLASLHNSKKVFELLIKADIDIDEKKIFKLKNYIDEDNFVRLLNYHSLQKLKEMNKKKYDMTMKELPDAVTEYSLEPESLKIKMIGFSFQYKNGKDIKEIYKEYQSSPEANKLSLMYDIDTIDKFEDRLKEMSKE